MKGRTPNPVDPNSFGGRLQRLRLAAGYATQVKLAERLKVTNAAVSFWEQDRRVPLYPTMLRIAEILGVSSTYLLTGQEGAGDLKAAIRRTILARKPTSDIMRMCTDA